MAYYQYCFSLQMEIIIGKSSFCFSYRNQSLDLHCKLNDWCLYKMQHLVEIG